MKNTWLSEHARNVTSQFGEDGLIEKILETVGERDRWCVEFGAWDGIHYSNTCNLIRSHGYSAVMIEADAKRLEELKQNYNDNPRVISVCAIVGFSPSDSLDTILAGTPIPKNFDFLSIDIDGNDYYAWEAVTQYRPKVVAIEYNPTIPTPVEFVQVRDMSVSQGSSLASLAKLGKTKGYELVAATRTNGLFVDRKYFERFGIADNSVAVLRTDESRVTYIFNGYDGTVFIRGFGGMNWHRMPYRESRMQQLPRCLRVYPEQYGPGRKILARIFRTLRRWGIF